MINFFIILFNIVNIDYFYFKIKYKKIKWDLNCFKKIIFINKIINNSLLFIKIFLKDKKIKLFECNSSISICSINKDKIYISKNGLTFIKFYKSKYLLEIIAKL